MDRIKIHAIPRFYVLLSSAKVELIFTSFILLYYCSSVSLSYLIQGDGPYVRDKFAPFFLVIPISIAALYLYLIRSAIRKENIITPIRRWTKATILAAGLGFFFPSFTSMKDLIPHFIPFYFDKYLISVDRFISFGVDPWVIAHKLGIFTNMVFFDFVYFRMWTFLVVGFLIFLTYFDKNRARILRYISLFLATWVILGNILAMIFSSVGPIYVKRVYGINYFDPLYVDLGNVTGYKASIFYQVQNYLWENYISGAEQFGTGISAFPSVHVGMVFVIFLYLSERSRLLMAPGLIYLILIFVGSVFCGLHYAIDGYVSIIVVFLMHVGIGKFANARIFRTFRSAVKEKRCQNKRCKKPGPATTGDEEFIPILQ